MCMCVCVSMRTCIYVWTHRISCPGASGRQSDNIEKEILTVIKQFVHFCVGTKDRQAKKRNNSDFFFQSCYKFFKEKKPKITSSSLPQVNGVSVDGKTHSEVVAAIKAGGDETRLLVVDPDTDTFFKRCRVAPTTDHLTGERTHRQDDFTVA